MSKWVDGKLVEETSHVETCSNCGRCPTCGRGPQPPHHPYYYPWYNRPYWFTNDWNTYTYPVTISNTDSSTIKEFPTYDTVGSTLSLVAA